MGNVSGFGGAGGPSAGGRGGAPSIGNVAGFGGPNAAGGRGAHRRSSSGAAGNGRPSPSPRSSAPADDGVRVPTPGGGEVLLTRRHFLYGALGVGALAAVGGGATVVAQQMAKDADDELTVLEVPESAVTAVLSSDLFAEVDSAERMQLTSSCELPFGSLVWANDESVAACLLPTEEGKPLTQAGLVMLSSGSYVVVLEQAVGLDEGFEIYDVRATSSGLVWTEADILDGIWRVYTARWDGSALGAPALVEEGDGEWETPTLAAVGNRAFWQVLPKADGAKKAEDSLVKRATMGTNDVETVWTSHGRLASPPYGMRDSVVITPRTDTGSIHYQLTRLDAESGQVLDSLVLPASMRPLEAGYGETGFTFAFDGSYQYGDGIANLGTYLPEAAVTNGDYSGSPWLWFDRSPSAAPAWCGSFFMVKSTSAVSGVNPVTREWFAIYPEDGADKEGEYLASTGTHDVLVTFTNLDDKPLDGEPRKCCLVRTWSPLA
ncbi:Tat pathway signal protein [Arabiibacter massiliensis]|uniref:Tat pathway signal protein n=1 Tax=Arabiibacter massiliensis TaxID=1870985 RepID=UPI00155AC7BD|nr:Tat pathway signal protein [Arabiibacter massiliensis]